MAMFTDEQYRANGIEPPSRVAEEEEPGFGTRLLGNIQAGIGDVQGKVAGLAKTAVQIAQLGQMSPADAAAWDTARKEVEGTWHGMDAASQVIKHPATSTIGGIGESLVRFAPQIPLYAGAGAVLGPAAGAGLRLAHAPGAAAWLTGTGGGLASSTARAAVRGAMEGGAVGLASAHEGQRLQEAKEEAIGFGTAAPAFHLAGKAIGYAGKKIIKGLTAEQPKMGELVGMKSRAEAPESWEFYKQGESESTWPSWRQAKKSLEQLREEGQTDLVVAKDKTYGKYYLMREKEQHPVAVEPEADISGIDRPQEIKQEPGKPPVRVIDKTEMEKPLGAAEMTLGEFKSRKEALKPFAVPEGPWASERDRVKAHVEAAAQGDPAAEGTMWMLDHLAKRLGRDPEQMYSKISSEGFDVGVLDKDGGRIAGQIWSQNGRHVLQMFAGSDTRTLMHESWHLAERFLDAETKMRMNEILLKDAALVKQMGLELNIKNPTKEYFARAYEQWLLTGKSTIEDPKIIGVFQKIKQWMLDMYGEIVHNKVGLSPEVEKFFGEFFNTNETAVSIRKAAIAAKKAEAEAVRKVQLAKIQEKQAAKLAAVKEAAEKKAARPAKKAKVVEPVAEPEIKQPAELLKEEAAPVEEPVTLSAGQQRTILERAVKTASSSGDVVETKKAREALAAFDKEQAGRPKEAVVEQPKVEEAAETGPQKSIAEKLLEDSEEKPLEVGPLFERPQLEVAKETSRFPETMDEFTTFELVSKDNNKAVVRAMTSHPDRPGEIVKERDIEMSAADFNEHFAEVSFQKVDPRFDELGFRRRLEEVIQRLPFETISPKKVMSLLEREVKKGTMKAEELRWSSLGDLMEATVNEKITKKELLEAAQATGLKLKEIKFGELDRNQVLQQNILGQAARRMTDAAYKVAAENDAIDIKYWNQRTQKYDKTLGQYLNDTIELKNQEMYIPKTHPRFQEIKEAKQLVQSDIEQGIKSNKVSTGFQMQTLLRDLYHRYMAEYSGLTGSPKEIERKANILGDKVDLIRDLDTSDFNVDISGPAEVIKRFSFLRSIASKLEEKEIDLSDRDTAEYTAYTVPGGTNKREFLIQMPGETKFRDRIHWIGKPGRASENIVGWLRTSDRIDEDGMKVLFIEEIQSQWHHQGRKKGYKPRNIEEAMKLGYKIEPADVLPGHIVYDKKWFKNAEDAARAFEKGEGTGETSDPLNGIWADTNTVSEAHGYLWQMQKYFKEHPHPDNPDLAVTTFLPKSKGYKVIAPEGTVASSNSKSLKDAQQVVMYLAGMDRGVEHGPFGEGQWQQLMLKRALQKASAEGYGRVAWVDGATTADHYSLRKHISEIRSYKSNETTSSPEGYAVHVEDLQGNEIHRVSKTYTAKELRDTFPTEIAERIIKEAPDTVDSNFKPLKITGLDLEMGGEWAKALYDKAVPDIMKKLTKEQPKTLGFELPGGEVKNFKGVDITEGFQEKMDTEGFSLFQKGLPREDSPGWDSYVKEIEKAIMNKEPVTLETLKKTSEYSDLIRQTYEDKLEFQKQKVQTEMEKMSKPELEEAKAMEQYADSEQKRGLFEILNKAIKNEKFDSDQAKQGAELLQAVNANTPILDRLSVASNNPEFLKAVNIAELKKLSGLEERATPGEHLAQIKLASDAFTKIYKDDPRWFMDNPAKAAKVFDSFQQISEAITKWDERIESAQMSWLYDPKMESRRWLKGAWAVAADDLFSTKNPAVLHALTKINGMHWLAKKFPVLQPLYELQWKRLEDATILAGDIMKGSMEMPVEWKGKQFNLDGFAPLFRLMEKDPKGYEWAKNLLWVGDGMGKRFSTEEVSALTAKAFGKPRQDIIFAYDAVRNTQDWMFAKLMNYLTQGVDDPKKVEALEKELADKIRYHPGYIPHTREGKWSLVVFENAKKNDAAHMERMPNHYDATKRLEELKKEYPGKEVRLLPVREAIKMGITAKQELVSVLDELMKTTGTEQSVADALRSAAVEMIKEKGYWTHFKGREDVPGYDLRLGRILHQQAQEFAGFMSKMDFAKSGWQELSQLRAGGYNELHNYSRDWFDLMLRNSDGTDQFFGRLRSALFLKYLGMNVKSALVSVAEKATNVPYFLSFYTDKPHQANAVAMKDIVGWTKWKKDAAKYIKENQMTDYKYNWRDALKDVPLPAGVTEEEALALRQLFHRGATRAQFMQEVAATMEGRWEQGPQEPGKVSFGKAQDYIDKMGNQAMKYGTWLISHMEQMGRESTALAAFRIFREKGYEFDKAVRMSERLVLDSHFMYGKANQPLWLNKGGVNRLAKLALTFRTQEMNYLQMLGHMIDMPGRKGVMAAGKSLLTLAALGGGTALPFFAGVDKAITMATGTSPSASIRKKLDEMTDSEYLGELFASGAPGLLGLNMTGSMRVGGDFTLKEMLGGAAGSAAQDVYAGAKSVGQGDWMSAAEKLLPMVAANPIKAYERYKYGVTTGRGNPVTMAPGEDILKLSGMQALSSMIGFQPAELAKAYEREGVRVRSDEYWKGKRSSIYTSLKKGLARGDEAAVNRAFERIAEFNESIPSSVSPITSQAIKQSLSTRPQIRKMLQHEEAFGSVGAGD